MRARLLSASILTFVLVAIAMVYRGPRGTGLPAFVSPEVAMALGHAEATAYARRELPPSKRSHQLPNGESTVLTLDAIDALREARQAVVRLAVTHRLGDSSRTSHGSGVLVEAGRFVLTAGHVVADVADPAAAEITVYLPQPLRSGRSDAEFSARVVEWRHGDDAQGVMQDWALLEVVAPMVDMPSATIATAASSSLRFCYGFPTQLGLDGEGHVVPWQPSRCLEPLLTIVEPSTNDPTNVRMPLFTPLAGCLSHAGQSGGPVFDANGSVVHVISGNNTWWHGAQHQHWIRAASLDAAIAALARLRKGRGEPR
jgi:hypothetical protein